MISRPLARTLVVRFRGKLGYPQTNEGLKALLDTFQDAPENAEQAAEMVQRLDVDTAATWCPSMRKVRAVAAEVRDFWRRVERYGNGERGLFPHEEMLARSGDWSPAQLKMAQDFLDWVLVRAKAAA